MRIYLDTCTLHRPLDDRSQLRIAVEADAVLTLLTLCERGTLTLVVSAVNAFETARNPRPQRVLFVQAIMARAAEYAPLTDAIEARAQALERAGVKAIDALHWATAEAAAVDRFCTCDDRFYRKMKTMPGVTVKAVTPLELLQEVVPC